MRGLESYFASPIRTTIVDYQDSNFAGIILGQQRSYRFADDCGFVPGRYEGDDFLGGAFRRRERGFVNSPKSSAEQSEICPRSQRGSSHNFRHSVK
jgi:hypothetical protein